MKAATALFNHLFFGQLILEIQHQLPGPTLIYHDGSETDYVAEAARSLGNSRLLVLSEDRPRHRPETAPLTFGQMRSTLLVGGRRGCNETMLRNLRSWRLWSAQDPMLILSKADDVLCWLKTTWHVTRAVNIAVVVLESNPSFYTWFPYQSFECTNVSKVSTLSVKHLFPPKITMNSNGCSIFAVTSYMPPIVIDDYTGIETRLVRTIVEKLNLTLRYHRLPENMRVWNYFNQSGFPIGGMAMLWNNTADFMFCNGRIDLSTEMYSDSLPSHLEDEVSWFVPAPDALPQATAVFRAFSKEAWLMIAATFVLIFTCSYTLPLKKSRRATEAMIQAVSFNLNLSAIIEKSPSFRIFAIFAYAYSLHITTAYQSSLITFLTNTPYGKPLKTAEELAESDLPVEFLQDSNGFILNRPEPYFKLMLHPGRVRWSYMLNLDSIPLKKFGLLGPKLSFSFMINSNLDGFYKDENGRSLVIVLPEPLMKSSLTISISLGHPLLPLFRRYMSYLIEGGFIHKFISMESKARTTVTISREPFGLKNVEGAFYLLLCFSLASSIVFLIEKVSYMTFSTKAYKFNSGH